MTGSTSAEIAGLSLYIVYLALAFGLRSWLQIRRTGSAGFHGISGRVGSAEWVGGVSFPLAMLFGFLSPVLALADVVDAIGVFDEPLLQVIGAVLVVIAILGTLIAQASMGTSWRIGVDREDETELVTSGAFAFVRNPMFSSLIPLALGMFLLVPNVISLTSAVLLAVAVELQVRKVEEPYLCTAHADTYLPYAARVGRFVPGIGRIAPR